MCCDSVCSNIEQLADILHRRSSPVDTGVVVVRSSDAAVTGSSDPATTTAMDAAFFTRVHFDIFGVFFPLAVPRLDSAMQLLTDVYGSDKLTFCVTGAELSSSSSSLSSLHLCDGAAKRSLQETKQRKEVYTQELATLRRYTPIILLLCIRPDRVEALSRDARLTSDCLTSVCLSRTLGLTRE